TSFVPQVGFFQRDTTAGSNAIGCYYKGESSGSDARGLDGGNVNTFGTLGVGTFTSETNGHTNGMQLTYSVWRAINGCGFVMVQIYSYVGDGNTTQVLVPPTDQLS